MKLSYVYEKVSEVMNTLDSIDIMSYEKRRVNQAQVNKAYNILDSFRDELIRERIRRAGGTNE